MKCSKCGAEIGKVKPGRDEYDLLKDHLWSCSSKEAQAFREAYYEEGGRVQW